MSTPLDLPVLEKVDIFEEFKHIMQKPHSIVKFEKIFAIISFSEKKVLFWDSKKREVLANLSFHSPERVLEIVSLFFHTIKN